MSGEGTRPEGGHILFLLLRLGMGIWGFKFFLKCFKNQTLASFVQGKTFLVHFVSICSGVILVTLGSPRSVIASGHTPSYFPL